MHSPSGSPRVTLYSRAGCHLCEDAAAELRRIDVAFAEVDITMPQAKTLYAVGVSGEIHMSALVTRLGVSLSTVSGLVERLGDAGFATRHDDPADRRQVGGAITRARADVQLTARRVKGRPRPLERRTAGLGGHLVGPPGEHLPGQHPR